nr:class B sortase [uncultured Peptoniphilus sp.]
MDYRKIDFADPFVMVYGHMTKDGSMFGSLNAFKADGDVPSFEYSERGGHYRGEPVLAAIIDGETLIDPRDYGDFTKRAEFYHKLKQDAVFDTGYELKKEDHLVVLVTCSYERHNVRLVVVTVSGT